MPQAAIVAGIQGAATLGGAVLASRGSSKASQLQYRTAQEALAFEREQEMQRRKEYEAQQAQLKAEWDAYQERRRPYREAAERLLGGSGYSSPSSSRTSSGPPPGWTPGGSPGPSGMSMPIESPSFSGMGGMEGDSGLPPMTTPRFRANWGDWENYLG